MHKMLINIVQSLFLVSSALNPIYLIVYSVINFKDVFVSFFVLPTTQEFFQKKYTTLALYIHYIQQLYFVYPLH
jgi:hypothetical protein